MTRRLVWGIGVCVLLGVIAAAGRGWLNRERPLAARRFQFTYTASITLPESASQVRVWLPLAKSRDNQRILSTRIRSSAPYQIHEEPLYGNPLLTIALAAPLPPRLEVAIDYDAMVSRERRLGVGRFFQGAESVASAGELSVALRHEALMVVDEAVTRLARQVTAPHRGELAKARAIYDYVIRHMRYDKTAPGWGRGDTLRACRLGAGNCTDFHSLFISMARAVGIPARFVIGASIPPDADGPLPGYHCWAEFYSPAHGWVPVDASEAWKHPRLREYYFGTLDPNRILLSVGRNIQLVPAQAGSPVNIFVYPYVEVDGQPFADVETRFQVRSRTAEKEEARS